MCFQAVPAAVWKMCCVSIRRLPSQGGLEHQFRQWMTATLTKLVTIFRDTGFEWHLEVKSEVLLVIWTKRIWRKRTKWVDA